MTDTIATVTYHSWFPASVLLPTGEVWHRTRCYLTDTGLQVYRERTDDDTPDWTSSVDYNRTAMPGRPRAHVGVDVHTADGLVVITPTGQGTGCGSCGSPMRGWQPSYAVNVAAWPVKATA